MNETNETDINSNIFGTIGLVVVIFSLLLALVPCVGAYAMIPAILGTIFCYVEYSNLPEPAEGVKTSKKSKVGMIIGIVALVVGGVQYIVFKDAFDSASELDKKFDEAILDKVINEAIDSAQKRNGDSSKALDAILELRE